MVSKNIFRGGQIILLLNVHLFVAGFSWDKFTSVFERSIDFFKNKFGLTSGNNKVSTLENSASSLRPFDHQVAGHKYIGMKSSIGMMKESKEYLLKPAIDPIYGPREVDFYERLARTQDAEFEELKTFIPKYNGTKTIKIDDKDITFIRMEDITEHFKLPCIMDLKIGVQTWEPDASIIKIVQQTLHNPIMKKCWGISICGLKYYDVGERNIIIRDNMYYTKRILFQDTIRELYNFVNGEAGIEYGLVFGILEKLRKIRSWFQRQKRFTFFASSILITYDAQHLLNALKNHRAEEVAAADHNSTEIRIRMVDFAHVLPNTEDRLDVNYLNSLEKLIYIFENLNRLYENNNTGEMITCILHSFSPIEIFQYFKQFIPKFFLSFLRIVP